MKKNFKFNLGDIVGLKEEVKKYSYIAYWGTIESRRFIEDKEGITEFYTLENNSFLYSVKDLQLKNKWKYYHYQEEE